MKINFLCIYERIEIRNRFRALSKEIFRKSIHLCAAFVPIFLHFGKWATIFLLCGIFVFYVICDFLRLKGKTIPLISAVTMAAARKRDENRFVLGPVTLVLGVIFSAIFWDENSSAIGIFALAFGDGLASLGGKFFGNILIPKTGGKTVAGSLTCFFAILISSFLVCKDCKIALILGVVGMLIEILPLKDYDNLLIPVFLGGLSQFLRT